MARWSGLVVLAVGLSAACTRDDAPLAADVLAPARSIASSSVDARARILDIQRRFQIAGQATPAVAPSPEVAFDDGGPTRLVVRVPEKDRGLAQVARVVLPRSTEAAVEVRATSSVAVRFTLRGAVAAPADIVDGLVLHRRGHGGADVLRRPDVDGIEDFVVFEEKPAAEELVYDVDVTEVAGLRLVESTLELLDERGSPRLRIAPPWVVDAKGERRVASLRVEGCAYDTSTQPPWGRPVTPPTSPTCSVHVVWTGTSYSLLVDPSWTTTGALAVARDGFSATALPGGRALIAGGRDAGTAVKTTEIFDGATGTFAAGPSMTVARSGHAGVALPSGKVLIAAGGAFTAEIYNPAVSAFGATINMPPGMTRTEGVLLAGGKVLLVSRSAQSLTFDEVTGAFTQTTNNYARNPDLNFKLMAMKSGKGVLYSGVNTGGFQGCVIELYDPATNSFGAPIDLSPGMAGPAVSVLPDDRLLVTGGYDLFPHELARIYDPVAGGQPKPTGNLGISRYRHSSTLLPNGQVLILGGEVKINGERAVEAYDLKSGTFLPATSLARVHPTPSITVLTTGKVLVLDQPLTTQNKTGELYDPARVAGAACSANVDCLSGFCTDGVCCDTTCAGSCQACNLPGKAGVCSAVTGTPPSTRAPCEGSGTCAGTCDGKEPTCVYPAPSSICGSVCADNKQTLSRCNGEGKCVAANATSCNNLSCADEKSCKTVCASKADCVEGFECVAGACVLGTKCVDDHTAQPATGPARECAPYRCTAGCLTSCRSIEDCAGSNVCSATGECIPPSGDGPADEGCAIGHQTRDDNLGWLAALSLSMICARRRRRTSGGL